MPKGKSVVVFSTKSNRTTKENISNVYGAKTLLALIPLDLELEFESSMGPRGRNTQADGTTNKIFVHGYISKPVVGEGRQTPDRQMFFVNSRPCGLPQIARAFNEVYRSFNISQSPFIFANFEMDTNAYDVNVSPDKRTILLHDAGVLIDSLKTSLTELFETSDQTVPQSQFLTQTQSTIKHMVKSGQSDSLRAATKKAAATSQNFEGMAGGMEESQNTQASIQNHPWQLDKFRKDSQGPDESPAVGPASSQGRGSPREAPADEDNELFVPLSTPDTPEQEANETGHKSSNPNQQNIRSIYQRTPQRSPNLIQNAFNRVRSTRPPAEIATITIGDNTVTSPIGYISPRKRKAHQEDSRSTVPPAKRHLGFITASKLGKTLRGFAAPGSQVQNEELLTADDETEDKSENESECSDHQTTPDHGPSRASETEEEVEHTDGDGGCSALDSESDTSYVDDQEQKMREEQRVAELIRAAEEAASVPSEHSIERANKMSKRSRGKDSTVELMCTIGGSLARIETQIQTLRANMDSLKYYRSADEHAAEDLSEQQESAEAKLSLTITKDDFAKMRVVGQFNLGFILAVRPGSHRSDLHGDDTHSTEDELFIVDQHASDEKYNFERLQAETVVQNQRFVKPKILDLTAVEEEIIIDNLSALEKNGFVVEVDTSGDEPIGRRCKLVSLPLSKEVVFNTRDLEELIVLLSESPQHHHDGRKSEADFAAKSSQWPVAGMYIPRPSKVRRMFAMRACRSSIMVGKSLTLKQMEKVVRHMGMIDKPWNCPHGRPTMRHLMSLGRWNECDEWPEMEVSDDESEDDGILEQRVAVWRRFLEEYGDIER